MPSQGEDKSWGAPVPKDAPTEPAEFRWHILKDGRFTGDWVEARWLEQAMFAARDAGYVEFELEREGELPSAFPRCPACWGSESVGPFEDDVEYWDVGAPDKAFEHDVTQKPHGSSASF